MIRTIVRSSAVAVIANVVVGAVALLHLYILVLEMFLWTTPRGWAAFGTEKEFAQASATLAARLARALS